MSQLVAFDLPDTGPTPFDYSSLNPAVADKMRTRASRIQRLQRASVLDIGRELVAAKESVEHGFFRDWVKSACRMHIRTAERLMQAALFVQENDKLSYLPPDGLLTLASRSAPQGTVSEIIGEISAGEKPSAAQIKRRIALAKKVEKRAREPLQGREVREVQGREDNQIAAGTNELIAMLLAWERFDEFMALLRNADVSSVSLTLKDRHDRLTFASITEGEGILTGTLEESPAIEAYAETPPRDQTEALPKARLLPFEAAGELGTDYRAEGATEAMGLVPLLTAVGIFPTIGASAASAAPTSTPLDSRERSDGVSAEDLMALWLALKRNTRLCGRQWIADGCLEVIHPGEHHRITEALVPLRLAASKANNTERDRFLEMSAVMAA
jgi:hypothetical protein